MTKQLLRLAATLSLAAALSACGSQQDEAGTESSQTASSELTIKAVNYKFDQAEYHVKAGEPVKLILDSKGNHGIEIAALDLKLSPSHKSQVITPKAGTYEFSCTILCGSGHTDMQAKLIVE